MKVLILLVVLVVCLISIFFYHFFVPQTKDFLGKAVTPDYFINRSITPYIFSSTKMAIPLYLAEAKVVKVFSSQGNISIVNASLARAFEWVWGYASTPTQQEMVGLVAEFSDSVQAKIAIHNMVHRLSVKKFVSLALSELSIGTHEIYRLKAFYSPKFFAFQSWYDPDCTECNNVTTFFWQKNRFVFIVSDIDDMKALEISLWMISRYIQSTRLHVNELKQLRALQD